MAWTPEQQRNIANFWSQYQTDPNTIMRGMGELGLSAQDMANFTGQSIDQFGNYLKSNGAANGFGGYSWGAEGMTNTTGSATPTTSTPTTGFGMKPQEGGGQFVIGGTAAGPNPSAFSPAPLAEVPTQFRAPQSQADRRQIELLVANGVAVPGYSTGPISYEDYYRGTGAGAGLMDRIGADLQAGGTGTINPTPGAWLSSDPWAALNKKPSPAQAAAMQAAGIPMSGRVLAPGSTPDPNSVIPQTVGTGIVKSAADLSGTTGFGGVGQYSNTVGTPATLENVKPWTITPEQTVAEQLRRINDPNSGIIQQARAQAMQEANARGLMNSSMALTGADAAAYQASIPIATADAATYAKAAGYNADAANQLNQLQYTQGNSVGMTREQLANAMAQARLSADTSRYSTDVGAATSRYGTDVNAQVNRYNTDVGAATSRYGTDVTAGTNRYNTDVTAGTNRYNTDVGAQTNRYNTDVNASTNRYNTDVGAGTSRYNTDVSAATSRYTSDLNANTQVAINKLDNESRLALQREGDANRGILQTSSSAASAYNNYATAMLNIQMNDKMDAGAKARALKAARETYVFAMQAAYKLSGAGIPDFSALLDFDTSPAATAPPPAAAAPGVNTPVTTLPDGTPYPFTSPPPG